jgi:hypothetical protein
MRKLTTFVKHAMIVEAMGDDLLGRFFGRSDAKMKGKFRTSFLDKRQNAISNAKVKRVVRLAPGGFLYNGNNLDQLTDSKFVDGWGYGRGSFYESNYTTGFKFIEPYSEVWVFADKDAKMIGYAMYNEGKVKTDGIVRGLKKPEDYIGYVIQNGGYVATTNLKEAADAFVPSSAGLIDKDNYLAAKNKYLTGRKIILSANDVNAIRKGNATIGDLVTYAKAPASNVNVDYSGMNKALIAQLTSYKTALLSTLASDMPKLHSTEINWHGSLVNVNYYATDSKLYLLITFSRSSDQYDRAAGYRLSGHIAVDITNPKQLIQTRIDKLTGLKRSATSTSVYEVYGEYGTSIWGAYELTEYKDGFSTNAKFAGEIKKFILDIGKTKEVGQMNRAWQEYQNKINVETFGASSQLTTLGSTESKNILLQIHDKILSALGLSDQNSLTKKNVIDDKDNYWGSLYCQI